MANRSLQKNEILIRPGSQATLDQAREIVRANLIRSEQDNPAHCYFAHLFDARDGSLRAIYSDLCASQFNMAQTEFLLIGPDGELGVDLSGYISNEVLQEELKKIRESIPEQAKVPDLSNYATQDQLPDLSNYVTHNELPKPVEMPESLSKDIAAFRLEVKRLSAQIEKSSQNDRTIAVNAQDRKSRVNNAQLRAFGVDVVITPASGDPYPVRMIKLEPEVSGGIKKNTKSTGVRIRTVNTNVHYAIEESLIPQQPEFSKVTIDGAEWGIAGIEPGSDMPVMSLVPYQESNQEPTQWLRVI